MNVGFFFANVVGAVLYLVGTSYGWVNQAERGVVPVTGEPFIWAAAAIPIVAVFTLVNLTWGVLLLRRGRRRGGRVWLAAAGLWLGVIVIDFAHHGYPAWTYWWHTEERSASPARGGGSWVAGRPGLRQSGTHISDGEAV